MAAAGVLATTRAASPNKQMRVVDMMSSSCLSAFKTFERNGTGHFSLRQGWGSLAHTAVGTSCPQARQSGHDLAGAALRQVEQLLDSLLFLTTRSEATGHLSVTNSGVRKRHLPLKITPKPSYFERHEGRCPCRQGILARQ
jgi:hypothetical protein